MKRLFYIFIFLSSFTNAQELSGYNRKFVAFNDVIVAHSGSLTATEKKSANFLVGYLQNHGMSNDSVFWCYPMIGRSLANCRFNIWSATSYSITFVNTVDADFTSGGWRPNGTTSYAVTSWTPSASATLNSTGMHMITTATVASANALDMGCRNTGANAMDIGIRITGDVYSTQYNTTTTQGRAVITNTIGSASGIFSCVRKSATENNIYVNNSLQFTQTTSGGALPERGFYLGGVNNSGTLLVPCSHLFSGAMATTGIGTTSVGVIYDAFTRMNKFLGR